jgi:hypothetical protein
VAQDADLYSPTFYDLISIIEANSLPKYAEVIGLLLILLLSLKMIFQGSKVWSGLLATSLNRAIYPLLLIYGVIVFFRVAGIVAQNLRN